MEPPLMAVVPPLIDRLAAAKVLVMVLVPVVVRVTAPNAVPEPTAPVKVTPPLPLEMLKARAVVVLLTVESNLTKLLVVVKVVSAPKVTSPE